MFDDTRIEELEKENQKLQERIIDLETDYNNVVDTNAENYDLVLRYKDKVLDLLEMVYNHYLNHRELTKKIEKDSDEFSMSENEDEIILEQIENNIEDLLSVIIDENIEDLLSDTYWEKFIDCFIYLFNKISLPLSYKLNTYIIERIHYSKSTLNIQEPVNYIKNYILNCPQKRIIPSQVRCNQNLKYLIFDENIEQLYNKHKDIINEPVIYELNINEQNRKKYLKEVKKNYLKGKIRL